MRRLTRRDLLTAALSASSVLVVSSCGLVTSTRQTRIPRIGWLGIGPPEPRPFPATAFSDGLREIGYIDGQNCSVEWRFAPPGDVNELAQELVGLPVDVMVTSGTPEVVAAAGATHTLPVVSGGPSRDLIDLGLVQSYARPGANVTGTGANRDVYRKLVEILKQVVPTMARVGYLRDPGVPGSTQQMQLSQASATQLGLDFIEFQATNASEIESAFQAAASSGIHGVVISGAGGYGTLYGPIALRYRVPTISSQVQNYVDHSTLLGYSPDFAASQRRAARYVDKILKGASAADLPVEQAMTFELGVNLQTATALGVTIPEDVLVQATFVVR
jgi:putative ABC transport system substrate-binding protein